MLIDQQQVFKASILEVKTNVGHNPRLNWVINNFFHCHVYEKFNILKMTKGLQNLLDDCVVLTYMSRTVGPQINLRSNIQAAELNITQACTRKKRQSITWQF